MKTSLVRYCSGSLSAFSWFSLSVGALTSLGREPVTAMAAAGVQTGIL